MPSPAAELHVRWLAEAQLRRAATAPRYLWLDEDFRLGGQPAEEEGLLRIKAVLNALHRVGAIDDGTAWSVVSEFAAALAARGLGPAKDLLRTAIPDSTAHQPDEPGPAPPPGGVYQAIPISAVFTAELDGYQGEVHLQTLIRGPDCALIITTFVSRWREAASLPAGDAPGQPGFPPFGPAGLTDDQGRHYRLDYETAEGGWHQYGVLSISPVPPSGTRWLDLPAGSGGVLRIELNRPDPAARVASQPIRPATAGEQLLTAAADTLLGGGSMVGMSATALAASLAEVETALCAVGALPAGSAAVAHLAALCQHRSVEVRGDLATRAQAAGLPGPWASVLAGRHDGPGDGRAGLLPLAAVLPETDGARFVLGGLCCWERQVTMPVVAWGWAPRPRVFRPGQPFSWWARDDTGRWHVGRTSPYHLPARTFQVEFTPPLHPGATSLDIMLTGAASRVTVSVPLRWPDEPA
ncbi:MAG TPA: hypothetical protein VIP48_05575 [Streptosporangiaceae bacterium]